MNRKLQKTIQTINHKHMHMIVQQFNIIHLMETYTDRHCCQVTHTETNYARICPRFQHTVNNSLIIVKLQHMSTYDFSFYSYLYSLFLKEKQKKKKT